MIYVGCLLLSIVQYFNFQNVLYHQTVLKLELCLCTQMFALSYHCVVIWCAVKFSLTSAAKLRQAEAAMNMRGRKKKTKKFQTTAEMDLACSQQKVDPQAGSELCVASLRGMW